ncbi:hypothetical protein IFU40_06180 [Microbacterium sp. CFBP 13617]|uniref:hypothetical protein n=1 Tax=Microbacterium sp. CFBP 13617 TaxID=2774035 RepID=UPI001784EEB1|nr:hypothetical protein [Microbacterium sp. CFBP 13617]MBD8218220.1 hypothetical protein [Microbacterium sp. CFBP 13617]
MIEIVVTTGGESGATVLDWLPIVISGGAFVVALSALMYTVVARAVPVLDAFDSVDEDGVLVAHGVHVYNVGRRTLALRRIGLVQPDGKLRYAIDDHPDGLASANPELPITIAPGEVKVFVMPLLMLVDPARTSWTYRALYVTGRRRSGEPKVGRIEATRRKPDDVKMPW